MKLKLLGYGTKAHIDSYSWIWEIASRSTTLEDRPVIDIGVEFDVPHLALFAVRKCVFQKHGYGPYMSYDSMLWMNFMDACRELQECVQPQYVVGGGLSISKPSILSSRAYKIKLYPKIVHFLKNINERRLGDMPHPSTNKNCGKRYEHLQNVYENYFKAGVADQFAGSFTGFRLEITVSGFSLNECLDIFDAEFYALFQHVKVLKYPLPKYLANIAKFVGFMTSVGPARGRDEVLCDDKYKVPLAFVGQELGLTSYVCHVFLSRRAFFDDNIRSWNWCSSNYIALNEPDLPPVDAPVDVDDAQGDQHLDDFHARYDAETREIMLDVFLNVYAKSVGLGDAKLFKSRDKRSGRFSETNRTMFGLAERIATLHKASWRTHFVCKVKNLYSGLSEVNKLEAFRRLVADQHTRVGILMTVWMTFQPTYLFLCSLQTPKCFGPSPWCGIVKLSIVDGVLQTRW
ncbi:hypothetical protein H257_09109 [Aphanomyces astaci]|uniref:Uncharacterized protein n=1 Tax=Aphanomyces astaci TaxID=112090 RepID=W4GC13_APHAT|nr:hypothetical protein H257_09109 [Aphanomyces astaci]ETV77222.1 hypothetical protein H257_09109 [Aphanomyces astaci]|eukprot:XP_009833528.1 hypothetical protein H257_09109 [Aphanomyces astaci]